jgi:hypothetical protein
MGQEQALKPHAGFSELNKSSLCALLTLKSSFDLKDNSHQLNPSTMQLIRSLTAAALLLASVVTAVDFAALDAADVEIREVNVTSAYKDIVVTAVADKRNYANQYTRPICVNSVKRVREGVLDATRTLHIEVTGCAVDTPRGLCDAGAACKKMHPFEVNLVGPVNATAVDLQSASQRGKTTKSPYVIRSIGVVN